MIPVYLDSSKTHYLSLVQMAWEVLMVIHKREDRELFVLPFHVATNLAPVEELRLKLQEAAAARFVVLHLLPVSFESCQLF